jgi:uncharacterized protein
MTRPSDPPASAPKHHKEPAVCYAGSSALSIISKSESGQNHPMGLRYLLLGLALWGLFLIIRHLARQRGKQQVKGSRPKAVDSVQCAHCGLHLPREEALQRGGTYYCSQAHLEAANKDNPPD